MTTAHDIPLLISSANASSERRISPAWTIAHLKDRLEPITGIPSSVQRLRLGGKLLEAQDEENTQLSVFAPQPYSDLEVIDIRPKGMQTNYTDVSTVQKYEMPATEYAALPNSVLAWKKNQKLGRFDPNAGTIEEQKIAAVQREIDERGIVVGARCQLVLGKGPGSMSGPNGQEDGRRGEVKFIGIVEQIPGLGSWVGVALDEPTGKNDGSVKGKRYFECLPNCGVFVRPERVEVGEFPVLDDLGDEFEEM